MGQTPACGQDELARMIKNAASVRCPARLAVILPLAAIVLTASMASAQSPLKSAQSFAVLGATTVTNTGLTVITGGVSPGTAITGVPPGTVIGGGTTDAGDMAAAQAQADAHLAYAGLKAMTCPSLNNVSGQVLGTTVMSLPTGVYCFDTSAQLSANAVCSRRWLWIGSPTAAKPRRVETLPLTMS
jgi:hypothetical protein